MTAPVVLRAARWADLDAGVVRSPAVIVVVGDRIAAVAPAAGPASGSTEVEIPAGATELDLGDVTLLPGLMDMELNFLIGGPETPTGLPLPMHGVQDDPAYRAIRGTLNARATLMAGITTRTNYQLLAEGTHE